MRALAIVAIVGGMFAAAACAAPTPGSDLPSNPCDDGTDCTTSKKKEHNTGNAALPPAPAAMAAPAPDAAAPAPTHDAGADSSTAPVTTQYCKDLNGCCGSLTDTIEKFACIGVAIAGKETPCRVELAVCSAGGLGLGGLGGAGGGGGSECNDLSTCCDQMESEGYSGDASDCRGHLSGNNAGVCSSWLTEYRDLNWCN